MTINVKFDVKWLLRFFVVASMPLVFLVLHSGNLLADNSFGVAIIASTGLDDKAERKVFQYLGGNPNIDQIYIVSDKDEFFEKLRKIKASGKTINNLIIAGHGSANAPMIEFAEGSLMPGDVDLKEKFGQLEQYKGFKERRQLKKEDTRSIDHKIAELDKEIDDILSVKSIMASNATVQLLNCSTTYSEKGRKFVHNLGEILLSKGGGTIIASTSDVAAYQIEDRWDLLFHSVRDLEWKERGEFYVWGDWMRHEIKMVPSVPGIDNEEEWFGTWSVKSHHEAGPAKGGRYNSKFTVSKTTDGCSVVWNTSKLECSLSGNTINFTGTHPSGGKMHWTFVRKGKVLIPEKSTFNGKIYGKVAYGTYEGRKI